MLLAILASPDAARGAIVLDTSLATFSSALAGGSYTETFTGSIATGPSYSFSGGTPTFGYTVTAPNSATPSLAVYLSGTFVGNNHSNEALAFTPTTGNISAFGGNFFVTNISDAFQPVAITLTVTDSLGAILVQTFTPTSSTVNSFRGFRSTGFITSVVLSGPGASLYNSADNVIVGQVMSAAVPEPSSFALCGVAGLVGLGYRRARRIRDAIA